MTAASHSRQTGPSPSPRWWRLAALLGLIGVIQASVAQERSGSSGLPTTVPVLPATPKANPEGAGKFLPLRSTNDAILEVVAGQSRLLRTSIALTAVGQPRAATVAVGDPSIIDFTIVDTRTIRLVGLRTGVTDLTIIAPDDQIFSYEVHSIIDVEGLRVQMQALFPDLTLKITSLRENLILEGQVPSVVVGQQVVQSLEAALSAIVANQERKIESARARDKNAPLAPGGEPQKPGGREDPKGKDGERPGTPVGPREDASNIQATVYRPQVINRLRLSCDLELLQKKLSAYFPDASLKVSHVDEPGIQQGMPNRANYYIVVEGQARDPAQVNRILEVIGAHIEGVRPVNQQQAGANAPTGSNLNSIAQGGAGAGQAGQGQNQQNQPSRPEIVNLIRIPTSQQVLLKVRVAELNRTAAREVGGDFLAVDAGNVFGTNIGNGSVVAGGTGSMTGLVGGATLSASARTTGYGVFNKENFEILFNALRRNQVLRILAEPNLVALNGQRANFLAGGQFFVPVTQSATGGAGAAITAQPVDFGVRLDFQAHILDGDIVRLTVNPEVSQPDFTVATTLVTGGSPVPGLNKRSAHTTVEMRQGQTLAIAGLLQVTLDGATSRIPGLGDLPILGPFFSNTTGGRTEKELVVLVTPYLIEPLASEQVGPLPGDEVKTPNDLEFYLLNRIEGRTSQDFRATTEYDDAMHIVRRLFRLHERHVRGPYGYCP